MPDVVVASACNKFHHGRQIFCLGAFFLGDFVHATLPKIIPHMAWVQMRAIPWSSHTDFWQPKCPPGLGLRTRCVRVLLKLVKTEVSRLK